MVIDESLALGAICDSRGGQIDVEIASDDYRFEMGKIG